MEKDNELEEITLEEFITDLKNQVYYFEANWREKQETGTKDHWPDSLPSGDWFEQFLAFLASSGRMEE